MSVGSGSKLYLLKRERLNLNLKTRTRTRKDEEEEAVAKESRKHGASVRARRWLCTENRLCLHGTTFHTRTVYTEAQGRSLTGPHADLPAPLPSRPLSAARRRLPLRAGAAPRGAPPTEQAQPAPPRVASPRRIRRISLDSRPAEHRGRRHHARLRGQAGPEPEPPLPPVRLGGPCGRGA